MWLCTTDGFYSVIQWYDGRICIRARERVALDRLRKAHLPELTKEPITPTKDYRYRGFCSRDELERAMVSLSRDVTYGNFKDAVYRKQGKSTYERVLHSAWSLFGRLQPAGPYSAHVRSRDYPAIPKGEQKKQLAAQRALPLSSVEFRARVVTCDDCGAQAPTTTMLKIAGGWVCREVGACLDRRAAAPA